ncbi:MAG TPA: nicotinate-nucleotide--dimethylbenzimidazole phosphoribosyltransferase [Bacillota bacterium]|nr:nicotinate-nucleotide--dimethylbenzimidazole phosphoribosyltransferase [Bacillota bacterium]
MPLLEQTIAQIGELNQAIMAEISEHQNQLTKPPGSLGVLEELAIRIGGITGEKFPKITQKAVVVMAGDHGVTAEKVSAYPPEVTPQMVMNFVQGGAAINVLARQAGAKVVVVDVGVAAPVEHEKILSRKIRPGTANLAAGPAMNREEAVKALEIGISVAEDLIAEGFQTLATGEMGIGNTTASSAIMAAFLNIPAREVTGRGTGINEAAVLHKEQVIDRALALNQPDPGDPLDVLTKVGGLEIGALAGLILGAAAHRKPIVIDGFISTTAALIAVKLASKSLPYIIASHCSAEMAHRKLLQYLELKPVLELEMRLGEGTGAALAFNIIEAALRVNREMATFTSAGVSQV